MSQSSNPTADTVLADSFSRGVYPVMSTVELMKGLDGILFLGGFLMSSGLLTLLNERTAVKSHMLMV